MVNPLSPWRQPRLWTTLLWSLALALPLAAWHAAELSLATRAAANPMLLLPERELAADERDKALNNLQKDGAVALARWLAPADQSRALERRFGDQPWPQLLPAANDAARADWLPWMLEVHFKNPLNNRAAVDALTRRLKSENWQVMYESERGLLLARQRDQLRSAIGIYCVFALLAGAGALLMQPWPTAGGIALWAWSAAMGATAPTAVMAAAWLAGFPLNPSTAAIASGAGFAVAGLLAPMLRQRTVGKHLDMIA
jgi:hypothetical protein